MPNHIQNTTISTYNQHKIVNEIFYILFLVLSSKSGVYFTLTVHLHSDQPHFKCSLATRGRGLRQRTAQFYLD